MESMTFVLFGATGDLAKRKIYPALYNLFIDQKIEKPISVIGLGRRNIADHDFQAQVKKSIQDFSRRPIQDDPKMESFLQWFRYCTLEVTKAEDYQSLLQVVKEREEELNIPENRMFYLSVAPDFFDLIALHINESGLGTTKGWKRLMIEKPFGRDLPSAWELNKNLSKAFKEEEIYRIDHYLGKTMVQKLESLVSANPLMQTLWSKYQIANVQITASEVVGVEERAAYYDHSGAIRDMFQNHILQLVMLVAINQPNRAEVINIHEEKKRIVQALRPVRISDAKLSIIRGQYHSGNVNGREVNDYRSEPGVAPTSQTDTFVAAKLVIDDPYWQGIPFYIRTGKRMKEKSTRIVIEFKTPLNEHKEQGEPNLLIIEMAPNERAYFQFKSQSLKQELSTNPMNMDVVATQENNPEAYERLIFDAICGDSTFFAHWDEVELSWSWIQPILEAFQENQLPLFEYSSGSNGPEASRRLLEQDGFSWWLDKEIAEVRN
ncbi:glucose-6-phosphate dehydrogenase [Bacillus sp. PS06]|uniref:glucose-6-phosphate dehydrogenase n=1 Tax=Bacillus sp. PS06 TaxID=2764176 RepID=UPI0017811909|nr:glucose-6-phosphate dehydrogenase [Bacillus sp. PS06]MBD8070739.1 glucose-6-phosphate dehydrogenase [Bacillus sp. PS06]